MSISLTINTQPGSGIQIVFYWERNNRQLSCLPRTKQPENFPSTVLESNECSQLFPLFIGSRQWGCYEHFNWDN